MKLERKIASAVETIPSETQAQKRGMEFEIWKVDSGVMCLRVSRPVGTSGTVRTIHWFSVGGDCEVDTNIFEWMREKAG